MAVLPYGWLVQMALPLLLALLGERPLFRCFRGVKGPEVSPEPAGSPLPLAGNNLGATAALPRPVLVRGLRQSGSPV